MTKKLTNSSSDGGWMKTNTQSKFTFFTLFTPCESISMMQILPESKTSWTALLLEMKWTRNKIRRSKAHICAIWDWTQRGKGFEDKIPAIQSICDSESAQAGKLEKRSATFDKTCFCLFLLFCRQSLVSLRWISCTPETLIMKSSQIIKKLPRSIDIAREFGTFQKFPIFDGFQHIFFLRKVVVFKRDWNKWRRLLLCG